MGPRPPIFGLRSDGYGYYSQPNYYDYSWNPTAYDYRSSDTYGYGSAAGRSGWQDSGYSYYPYYYGRYGY